MFTTLENLKAAYPGQFDDEQAQNLLTLSELLVADYLTGTSFDPANPKHEQAAARAVEQQCHVWRAANIDPETNGLTQDKTLIASASLATGSVTFSDTQQVQANREKTATTLSDIAALILKQAGIKPLPVRVIG